MEVKAIPIDLSIERTDDASVLSDFYCGVESMDKFIHSREEGLQKYVDLGLTNLFVVKEQETIIALFSLSKNSIVLDNFDRKNVKNDGGGQTMSHRIIEERDSFPAIEIDYLAVAECKRETENKYGSVIIDEIRNFALNDYGSATMFITVKALHTQKYSAVGFYRKCRFIISENDMNGYFCPGDDATTVQMYKPLFA